MEAFTSFTETFGLRDQLKQLVWNPNKEAINQHILTMTTICTPWRYSEII
jgi:hypothetical protein